jgi:hypothetical protein
MKIRVYPLLWNEQGGLFMPRDPKLHQMAVEFAQKEMGIEINFAQYVRTFIACEVDAQEQPQKVVGIGTFRMVPDIENMRFLNAKAAKKIIDRMHDWLSDQGVQRGSDVFVRISSGDDPYRCPQHLDWLKSEKAKPAERFVLPSR